MIVGYEKKKKRRFVNTHTARARLIVYRRVYFAISKEL